MVFSWLLTVAYYLSFVAGVLVLALIFWRYWTIGRPRAQRRLAYHFGTGMASLLAVGILYYSLPSIHAMIASDPRALRQSQVSLFRISLSTGYVSLALLCVSLWIGSLRLLKTRRRVPVHLDLRRDIGIWAGVIGLLHVVFGLFIHVRWNPLHNFVYPPHVTHSFPLRLGAFGIANHVGLMAALIVLVLLLISNDVSIKKLGRRRWKALQRWSYLLVILLIAHSILYQIVEHRPLLLVLLFSSIIAVTVVAQFTGFILHRRIDSTERSATVD